MQHDHQSNYESSSDEGERPRDSIGISWQSQEHTNYNVSMAKIDSFPPVQQVQIEPHLGLIYDRVMPLRAWFCLVVIFNARQPEPYARWCTNVGLMPCMSPMTPVKGLGTLSSPPMGLLTPVKQRDGWIWTFCPRQSILTLVVTPNENGPPSLPGHSGPSVREHASLGL